MTDPERTLAVVPVQRLELAKSRLAGQLTPAERRRLVLALLERVLVALTEASRVNATLVVSPDAEVLALAATRGAIPLEQRGVGLNPAVRLAQAVAIERGAERLLVVLADLALLRATEVDALLARAAPLVLAPDRHRQGTNLLALRPPDLLAPVFGPNSLIAFRALAAERELPLVEFHAPGTAFDLDTPDDLSALAALGVSLLPDLCTSHES